MRFFAIRGNCGNPQLTPKITCDCRVIIEIIFLGTFKNTKHSAIANSLFFFICHFSGELGKINFILFFLVVARFPLCGA